MRHNKESEEISFFDQENRVYAYYLVALSVTLILVITIFLYKHITPEEKWELEQKRYFVEDIKVKYGDNILQIFSPYQISTHQVQAMVKKVKKTINLEKLKINQKLQIEYIESIDGHKIPTSLLVPLDHKRKIKIDLQEEYPITEINVEFVRDVVEISGSINGSIIKSALASGAPTKNLREILNAYSNKIDLSKDIKKGDRFLMLIEKFIAKDRSSFFYGKTLYSSLTTNGKEHKLYLFKTQNNEHFFNENGESAKIALMKRPVTAKRISSPFGVRVHPTLGYKRMHTGVDFAAPAGTPVYAGGDGKITHIGRHGAYGKYIKIKHNQKLHTAYAHLKGFAKGLKTGSSVTQNQVIGYVGSTGRSTAPHLHYEVIINSKFVDPLKITFIPTKHLTAESKIEFLEYKKIIDSFLLQEQKQEDQLLTKLENYKFDTP